jgi:two-component system, OmpR family, response regulator
MAAFVSPILLVDEDLALAAFLAAYLGRQGFSAHVENDVDRGVVEALSGNYAMAVFEDAMPESKGSDALKRIRAQSELPVLMMTAGGGHQHGVAALELGADGYVAKPCTARELCARIRSILRRTQALNSEVRSPRTLVCGGLVLWPQQRRVEWNGEPLPLTSTEFSLLEALLRHAGRPVSKRDLSLLALGRSFTKDDRRVDVHVSSIRRKLCALMDGRSLIRAVQGQGYRLLGE